MKTLHILPLIALATVSAGIAQSNFQESRSFSHFSSFGSPFDGISLDSPGAGMRSPFAATDEEDKGGWTANLSSGARFTTNALSNSAEEDDWLWFGDARFTYEGVAKSGEKSLFRYGLTGGISSARYNEFSSQDGDAFLLASKITPFVSKERKLALSLIHESTWDFSPGFDENVLGLHSLGVELDKAFNVPDDDDQIESGVSIFARRVFADPSDFEVFNYGLEVGHSQGFGDNLTVSLGASVAYSDYDSFFGVDRNNWTFGAGAEVAYKVSEYASVSLEVAYGRSEDSLPGGVRDFNSFQVVPALKVKIEGK